MDAENTTRVSLYARMPAIKEKLIEVQKSLSDLTWEEKDDYFIFLHTLNLTIMYANRKEEVNQ